MHQPFMTLRSPGLRSLFYFQQYEADTCDPIALQAACLISTCFDPVTRLPPETKHLAVFAVLFKTPCMMNPSGMTKENI